MDLLQNKVKQFQFTNRFSIKFVVEHAYKKVDLQGNIQVLPSH